MIHYDQFLNHHLLKTAYLQFNSYSLPEKYTFHLNGILNCPVMYYVCYKKYKH